MRAIFLLLGFFGLLIVLGGCRPQLAPALQLSKHTSSQYTYVVKTGHPPAFGQSTFSEDRLDSSKKWLTSTSFSPQRITDENTQKFLNERDPVRVIRDNVEQSISRHLGWKKASGGEATFSINMGTSSWGVKNASGFGGYHLYYYSYLNVADKKGSEAFLSAKSRKQAMAILKAQTSSPLNLQCRYKSEKAYEFAEITTSKTLLAQELERAAKACSDKFDNLLFQH